MFKRFALFFMVSLLISISVSIIAGFIFRYLGINPGSMTGLFIMCLLFGMIGSFISLSISKWMAKKFMGVQLVEQNPNYQFIVQQVHQMAKQAGIEKMPEVGVYDSPELNAFATGPSKNNSMVAVSTGLIQRMNEDELTGVLGHEVAHIANGDMVTMTLVQGVVNAFVMFFASIITNIISNAMRRDDDDGEGFGGFFLRQFIYTIVSSLIGFLAMPIVFWFSRFREFRADHGGAALAGREKMIAALEALKRNYGIQEEVGNQHASVQTMQISSKRSMMKWWSSHPELEKRISALQNRQS
jgi:heat shock protein HtpX